MPDVSIPEGFSVPFTHAVRDFYVGNRSPHVIKELRSRFGTEQFYMEAVEEIFSENGWRFDAKMKKLMRQVFRGEVS